MDIFIVESKTDVIGSPWRRLEFYFESLNSAEKFMNSVVENMKINSKNEDVYIYKNDILWYKISKLYKFIK